jgi:hypothetical protein
MINQDIEETRRVHKQLEQTGALINAIFDVIKNEPPHVAMSGLMSCMARIMVVTNLPIELVTQGLAGLIEVRERQEK